MNECLVTKLQGEINDSTFPVFGEARIKATSETGVAIWVDSIVDGQVVDVYDPEGNKLSPQITKSMQGDLFRLFVSVGTTDYDYVEFVIRNKYIVKLVYGHDTAGYGAASDSKYYVTLSDFAYSEVSKIQREGVSVFFNAEDFSKPMYFKYYTIFNRFTANINHVGFLGGFVALESMRITREQMSGIYPYGEWCDVLSNMCKNGRVSGTCEFGLYSTNFRTTFNGREAHDIAFTVTFSSNGCNVVGGTNFDQYTGYTSASYDKTTDSWEFVDAE